MEGRCMCVLLMFATVKKPLVAALPEPFLSSQDTKILGDEVPQQNGSNTTSFYTCPYCISGYHCIGVSCYACVAGYTSAGGYGDCYPCDAGTYGPFAGSPCMTCGFGRSSGGGASECSIALWVWVVLGGAVVALLYYCHSKQQREQAAARERRERAAARATVTPRSYAQPPPAPCATVTPQPYAQPPPRPTPTPNRDAASSQPAPAKPAPAPASPREEFKKYLRQLGFNEQVASDASETIVTADNGVEVLQAIADSVRGNDAKLQQLMEDAEGDCEDIFAKYIQLKFEKFLKDSLGFNSEMASYTSKKATAEQIKEALRALTTGDDEAIQDLMRSLAADRDDILEHFFQIKAAKLFEAQLGVCSRKARKLSEIIVTRGNLKLIDDYLSEKPYAQEEVNKQIQAQLPLLAIVGVFG